MPDALLDSGSAFDKAQAQLGQWLRDTFHVAKALDREKLHSYPGRSFAAGWQVQVEHNNDLLTLEVLLDRSFPYSPIRVALKGEDRYLKWPHVEPGGLLCLPQLPLPATDIDDAIADTLASAIDLIDRCGDPKFVEEEFRREFISYWQRSIDSSTKPVRSLLDPTNHNPRPIAVWFGEKYLLVGETSDQVDNWLKNSGVENAKIKDGLFGHLAEAPIPPFPCSASELCQLLERHCPAALELLLERPLGRSAVIVLGASSPSGDGLIAVRLNMKNLNGFRQNSPAQVRLMLWKTHGQLVCNTVKRYDPAWIHGRGHNRDLPKLQETTTLILGCGSLGSQVALRLAQIGIGRMTLVDPETLASANVGRHALGLDSVGELKSTELARTIRRHYPHIQEARALPTTWQLALAKHPDVFETATLIVACLGEWSEDGPLGEWHARSKLRSPIVYGWLDEGGVASHAIALNSLGVSLSCVSESDGRLRTPETLWKDDGLIQAEPACGTLFQPYGPLDVVHAEGLVSRLCVDILSGAVVPPIHRIYAGSNAQIAAAGGEWSDEHKKHRPVGYDGPFEYERLLRSCGNCHVCTGADE